MIDKSVMVPHSPEDKSTTGGISREKLNILLGLLVVFAPLVILGAFGESLGDTTAAGGLIVTLAYAVSVLLATAVLRFQGRGWRAIGLARPASWPKTILFGVVTLVIYVLAGNLLQTLLAGIPGLEIAPADRSGYEAIGGNLPLLILYLVAAWTTIVFGEEMLFRAFLITNLTGLFAQPMIQWALALIGSSLFFGVAHYSWGLAGIIETTLLGFILGFAYLLSGRNLWIPIVAHGLGNTLGFILIFAGGQY